MFPAGSRPRSEIAIKVTCKRLPLRHEDERLESLVEGQLADPGRDRYRFAPGANAVLAEIKPQNLVDAFETDIGRGPIERERLGIKPSALSNLFAVIATQDRRGFYVGET